jgi:trk system potassium uptake protein TrkA
VAIITRRLLPTRYRLQPGRRADLRRGRSDVFVLVVGGGKVGYYLTKELIESGHEVVLMEKERARADQIADEIGSVVIPHDGCEGKYLGEAGSNRADIVAAVTGDDEDNLVICQMAKHHFDVPRTIARVNNPKNEHLFKHLGVDELISPTRMILGSIEQDIPVHELLHLAQLGEGELELIEAHLQGGSPAVGKATQDLQIPDGCSLFAVIRNGVATPLRPDMVLAEGDKVIAIGRAECQALLHEQLIGESEPAGTR